jgi:hypothetical protein
MDDDLPGTFSPGLESCVVGCIAENEENVNKHLVEAAKSSSGL